MADPKIIALVLLNCLWREEGLFHQMRYPVPQGSKDCKSADFFGLSTFSANNFTNPCSIGDYWSSYFEAMISNYLEPDNQRFVLAALLRSSKSSWIIQF